ncbi:MAG: hypothetical protein KKA81_01810 [Bacteroidetes bacterium]|nr:hypothetical protein [Bacteroidota bacterium]
MAQINRKMLFLILMTLIIGMGITGCKSKKKLAQEQAAIEYAQKMEQARQNLQAILNNDGSLTLEEREKLLRETKAMNIDDPELLMMLRDAEQMLKNERAELARKKESEEIKEVVLTREQQLEKYFSEISGAQSTDLANRKINDALGLFATPDAPVLIIISQSGSMKDYDRPTTIKDYLNYLKDQKKNINAVETISLDESGRIVELELIKK